MQSYLGTSHISHVKSISANYFLKFLIVSQMVALITGGENRDRDRWRNHQRLNSTEVWSPDFQCLLPPMTGQDEGFQRQLLIWILCISELLELH